MVADGVVVTADAMVEGVHWDHRSTAGDVGWKLGAVNASDVGAMGCRPTWAVLTMALPQPVDAAWVDAFAEGLGAALARFGGQLVGGDTTRGPDRRCLTLTMAGAGAAPVPRSGARPGDVLWVTGTLGEAAAGFLHDDPDGLSWLRRPEPPVELGAVLAERGLVRAMLDLSDGLTTDLHRLAAQSGVGAEVDAAALPVGPAVARRPADERLRLQVSFGDDYQLLFAAASADTGEIERVAADQGVAVRAIGRLVAQTGVRLSTGAWPRPSWQHFPRRDEPPPSAPGSTPRGGTAA
ncbi:MAG: thiamine-phosphate kinase [Alphaproteobacteria bacterium]|nr:thiamine-phosphate kinase [Alphaproteobacteria bacterium]